MLSVCQSNRWTVLYENKMDTSSEAKDRRVGAASAYVEARLAAGHVAFSLADMIRETGLSRIAATRQLGRLGAAVVRVSRLQSFFLIVPPEHRGRGAPPVEWWLGDYFRWLGAPYYLALLSAAGSHGSNPQGLQATQVMTGAPRRVLMVGELRVHFFVKRRMERTPTQELANAYAPTRVSTPAATVFDLIRYAGRIGGIGRAVETLRPLLPKISPTELRQVLQAEAEVATAQRLGYVLEKLGQTKLADVVDEWLPRRRLIPLAGNATGGKEQSRSARWQVQDGTGEFNP
jgi:hypothetical protein